MVSKDKRIKELENMITQSFLNNEGEIRCPTDGVIYCHDCLIKNICNEAQKIIKREEHENA